MTAVAESWPGKLLRPLPRRRWRNDLKNPAPRPRPRVRLAAYGNISHNSAPAAIGEISLVAGVSTVSIVVSRITETVASPIHRRVVLSRSMCRFGTCLLHLARRSLSSRFFRYSGACGDVAHRRYGDESAVRPRASCWVATRPDERLLNVAKVASARTAPHTAGPGAADTAIAAQARACSRRSCGPET